MLEVLSLLAVLVMSLIITRVATVALTLTGMRQESARFQARSALTGAGFTTNESERVVTHPVRRRIIMSLMLVGNTGLVLAASLMVILLGGEGQALRQRWEQVTLFLGGLVALYVAARSTWLERRMARWIERILSRHTDLPHRDYASLLRLGHDYRVVELEIQEGSWLAGRPLADLGIAQEGVLVLGIVRADGEYVGAPRGDARLEPGDTATLYGREAVLGEIDQRGSGIGGALEHAESVARQRREQEAQSQDAESEEAEPEDAEASEPGR